MRIILCIADCMLYRWQAMAQQEYAEIFTEAVYLFTTFYRKDGGMEAQGVVQDRFENEKDETQGAGGSIAFHRSI